MMQAHLGKEPHHYWFVSRSVWAPYVSYKAFPRPYCKHGWFVLLGFFSYTPLVTVYGIRRIKNENTQAYAAVAASILLLLVLWAIFHYKLKFVNSKDLRFGWKCDR